MEMLARFVIGGIVVLLFSLSGELFEPKSFAGLFGAAPSVAMATLALTIATKGPSYASVEARSMLAGAFALFLYGLVVVHVLMHRRVSAKVAALCSIAVWFAAAFGVWFIAVRPLQ